MLNKTGNRSGVVIKRPHGVKTSEKLSRLNVGFFRDESLNYKMG